MKTLQIKKKKNNLQLKNFHFCQKKLPNLKTFKDDNKW